MKIHSQLKTKKMNTTQVIENWNVQKGKLHQQFAILTDIDLKFEDSKNEYIKSIYKNANLKTHSK